MRQSAKGQPQADYIERLRKTAERNNHLYVLRRDGAKCRDCGTSENLTVHHLIRKADDASKIIDPKNEVILCRDCHNRKHQAKPIRSPKQETTA